MASVLRHRAYLNGLAGLTLAASALVLVACSDDSGANASGSATTGSTSDGGGPDGSSASGGQDSTDSGDCAAQCGANGTCVDDACECSDGYAGPSCSDCADGYVLDAEACVPIMLGGAGPGCLTPPQGPIGADWPEVFLGVEGCDDAGPGTRAQPFCSWQVAINANDVPATVTVLDGDYRFPEAGRGQVNKPGTAQEYFTLRADEGASPVFYGSERVEAGAWEAAGDGVWRTPVEGWRNNPTGLWLADGTRVLHQTDFDGGRLHANVAELVEPNRWTKANAGGIRCDNDNAGCFIYLRPSTGLVPNNEAFEASQANLLFALGSDYLVIRGLTTRFTQSSGLFVESSDFVLIEDNDFGHNSNGNDNAYSAFVQYADGTMLYNNRAFDSRYWGGYANSKGLTVMTGGDQADIWICGNEVWDIIGQGIATKSGVSNAHIVGNYVHEVATAIVVPSQRCHWNGCDVQLWPGGNWTIRENIIEGCREGIDMHTFNPEADYAGNRIYNNLFVDTGYGIKIDLGNRPEFIRNNIFIGGDAGLLLEAIISGEQGWPDRLLDNGLDSDRNLFFNTAAVMQHPNSSGASYTPLSLEEYVTQYGGDANSLGADPQLDADWRPGAGSPVLGAGDPSTYDANTVNIGLWPLFTP